MMQFHMSQWAVRLAMAAACIVGAAMLTGCAAVVQGVIKAACQPGKVDCLW